MHRTQKIALGFAVVLAAVTALGFILGLTDAEGRTFGIFSSTTSCTPRPLCGRSSPGSCRSARPSCS